MSSEILPLFFVYLIYFLLRTRFQATLIFCTKHYACTSSMYSNYVTVISHVLLNTCSVNIFFKIISGKKQAAPSPSRPSSVANCRKPSRNMEKQANSQVDSWSHERTEHEHLLHPSRKCSCYPSDFARNCHRSFKS